MMPISLPAPSSVKRNRPISVDVVRARALQRLYQRRTAVEDLIKSLEGYQRSNRRINQPGKRRSNQPHGAERAEFSAARTFPLTSAR